MKAKNKFRVNTISKPANVILNIFMIIYSAICVLPLILVLSVSFTDETSISINGYHLIPRKFSLYAYEFLFKDWQTIVRSYGLTIFVTIVGSILSVIIIAMCAYPLSRKDFKYRNHFAFFIFFTMLFNGGLVPWYIVYVKLLHLKNNILSLVIPLLVTPLYILIMRTYFSTTIPESVIESAKIDGAGEFKIFFNIILPLSIPSLATIGLFNTLNYWNDWYLSLLFITKEKLFTLQYLMYKTERSIQYLVMHVSQTSNTNAMKDLPTQTCRMAMAIIGIGPIIFAYPFFQKYFIQGLTIGAVKG